MKSLKETHFRVKKVIIQVPKVLNNIMLLRVVVTPRPDFDPVFYPDPRPNRGGDRGGSRECGKSGWGTGRGFKNFKSGEHYLRAELVHSITLVPK